MANGRQRRGLLVGLALVLGATSGIAYASIPDAGGVVHACFTKTSGSLRLIDTDAGQTCKSNESAIALYSKGGADAAFLGKSEKAADSDTLDGLDSTAFLGVNEKAADSEQLDGLDSTAFLPVNGKAADSNRLDGLPAFRYLRADFALMLTDFTPYVDGLVTTRTLPAEDSFPGMTFTFACHTDGTSSFTVSSSERFAWWWDDSFGVALAAPPAEQTFGIGNGVGRHRFRSSVFSNHTTTLDLDTHIDSDGCDVGYTLLRMQNNSPGP